MAGIVSHTKWTTGGPQGCDPLSKLTDSSLKSVIQKTSGTRDINDPACTGLQLRITPEARTWYFRYSWRGRRVRAMLGSYPSIGLAEARSKAFAGRDHLERGIDPRSAGMAPNPMATSAPSPSVSGAPLKPFSVEALAEEFMRVFITPRRKRPKDVQRILDKDVLSVWNGRDVRTITPRHVIDLLDGIIARGSNVMANRVADILGQMFTFGIHRAILDDSPVKLLIRPGGDEVARSRVLSDQELSVLIRTRTEVFKSPPIRHALVLLLLTLQRRGELAMAKWSHVDLENRTWHIPAENAKTARGYDVPLSVWAVEEFEVLKRLAGRSAYVFPDSTGKNHADPKLITRSVARCQKRLEELKVAKFTGHDLRRTGRTGLAKLKIAPHIAERCLNHSTGTAIERTYDVHDYFAERRLALEIWADHLRAIAS